MNNVVKRFAVLAVCAGTLTGCVATTQSTSDLGANAAHANMLQGVAATDAQAAYVNAINAIRTSHGLRALALHPSLNHAAQAQSDYAVRVGRLTHTGANGSSAGDRVKQAGLRSCLTAENLTAQYPTVDAAVAGWMASPGHRRNILLSQVTYLGVGVSANNTVATVFAQPC